MSLPTNSGAAPTAAAVESLFGLFEEMRLAMQVLLAEDPTGLAPMHLRVLQLCMRQPGLTQQALVRNTGRDKGQIAHLVRELCDQGMLERVPSLEDKRSHSLVPTPTGRQACQRFEDLGATLGRQLFLEWPDKDVANFIRRVEALRKRLPLNLPRR